MARKSRTEERGSSINVEEDSFAENVGNVVDDSPLSIDNESLLGQLELTEEEKQRAEENRRAEGKRHAEEEKQRIEEEAREGDPGEDRSSLTNNFITGNPPDNPNNIFQENRFHNLVLLSRQNVLAVGKIRANISSNSYVDTIEDKFRKENKRYWKPDENFQHTKYATETDRGKDAKFKIKSVNVVDDRTSTVLLEFVESENFNISQWQSYLEDIVDNNVSYYDHTFFLKMPFYKQTLKNSSFKGFAKSYNVEPTYNFYLRKFEESPENIDETLQPNMYYFIDEVKDNKKIREFTSLGIPEVDKVANTWYSSKDKTKSKTNINEPEFSQNYLNVWADSILESEGLIGSEDEYRKTAFDDVEVLRKYYSKKPIFPMNIEISVLSDGFLQLTNLFKESDYIPKIIKGIDADPPTEEEKDDFFSSIETTTAFEDGEEQIVASTSMQKLKISSWDVNNIVSKPEVDNELITFVENPPKEVGTLGNLLVGLDNFLRFKESYDLIINQYWRRYWELLNGNACYNEIMFYKVNKLDSESGKLLQEIYIPNTEVQGEELRYIDCQVKFGKEYSYEIFAYCLVVGSEYRYKRLDILGEFAQIVVEEVPSIKIFEMKYATRGNVSVVDSYPMMPDMMFNKYLGVRDKVLVRINSSAGEEKTEFISVNVDDVIEDGAMLNFKKDDFPSNFEVYRLEEEPKSYSDFLASRFFEVETNGSESGAFIDIIEPEKYYYYIARTVDVHQKVSNPTFVYRIIMLEGENNNYLEVDKFDFEEEEIEYVKNFRKYLFVRPSLQQRIIDETEFYKHESANNVMNPKLGMESENDSQWGKTYKLRIRSKKTKKALDVNFTFDYKFVRSENEKE